MFSVQVPRSAVPTSDADQDRNARRLTPTTIWGLAGPQFVVVAGDLEHRRKNRRARQAVGVSVSVTDAAGVDDRVWPLVPAVYRNHTSLLPGMPPENRTCRVAIGGSPRVLSTGEVTPRPTAVASAQVVVGRTAAAPAGGRSGVSVAGAHVSGESRQRGTRVDGPGGHDEIDL